MTTITINGKTLESDRFKEIEDFVLEEMRYWNNFESRQPLEMKVEKIIDPEALGVMTEDGIDAADIMGRR